MNMDKLKDIILYFLLNQQRDANHCAELIRIVLVLYLIDWHSAVKNDRVITNIQWNISNNCIQYTNDIESAIKDSTKFTLYSDNTIPFTLKMMVQAATSSYSWMFSEEEIDVFKRVIEISDARILQRLFIFSLSTYPVISSTKESTTDILGKAAEYKKLKQS